MHHSRRPVLAVLFFAGALLSGCGRTEAALVVSAEPSAVLRACPVAEVQAIAAGLLGKVNETGNRIGVRITPPGHHFATFLVVGELADDRVDGVLDELFAAMRSRMVAAGGHEDGNAERFAGLELPMLGVAPAPGAPPARVRQAGYRAGEHRGWITVLAVPEPAQAGCWRIAAALHEP